MKKTTKRISFLFLAMAMACGLSACSSTPSSSQSSSSAPAPSSQGGSQNSSAAPSQSSSESPSSSAAEDVTLHWAVWDVNLTTYYQPLIDAYTTEHPNVKIEMVDLGSSDYQNALITQLTGNADLDVVCVKDIPGYANLVKGGYLTALNDQGIDASLYGGTLEQITVDGSYYALPFRSDHWVVYYNKDLFDKAGVEYPTNDMTIAQYDELARKMTSGTGAEKVYGSHFHTWRSAASLFAVLDGKNTVVDGNYDFMKDTYDWVLKEQTDGICQDYGTLKATQTHYSGVFFNNQAAMMNMGSWFIPTQIEKVSTGESLAKNWGIVKYPHPEGVPAGTTLGTITSVAVNAASPKQDAAMDFVKFVGGEAGASIIAKTGTFPAIKSGDVLDLLASMPGFPTDENSKEALSTTQVYLEMPMHDKAADIEVVLNEAHDGIMTGAMSIEDGINKMNTEVSALLG